MVRNRKYTEDGIVYYRMERGIHGVLVAIKPDELGLARDAVAKRLRRARRQLTYCNSSGARIG